MEDGDEVFAENINITPQPQASITIQDQYTGYVVALYGGRGEKTASKTLNRATDTVRQPGSTFKILAAYAPAIDCYGKTLASVYNDAPFWYTYTEAARHLSLTYIFVCLLVYILWLFFKLTKMLTSSEHGTCSSWSLQCFQHLELDVKQ